MRAWALPRWVTSAHLLAQSKRQFLLDFGVYVSVGAFVAVFNSLALDFPFVGSGLKLFIGFVTLGLFSSLDLSLRRQRRLLLEPPGAGAHSPLLRRRLQPLSRKFFVLACALSLLICIILILVIVYDVRWLINQDLTVTNARLMLRSVMLEIAFVMAVLLSLTVNLLLTYSGNLKLLFARQSEVLDRVSRGDLDGYVPVTTNDEFGYVAGHINAMIEGLRDRLRIMEGLQVAEEVQKNLLPLSAPRIPGLDVAGKAIFSDETGGDYYDYLYLNGDGKLGVVVADVTGHGVGAALLMTTGRAFLRQRAQQPGDLASVASDVNRLLARDVDGSGQFMTMFFCVIDPAGGEIRYVDAGHGAALVYRPAEDAFLEFASGHLPLGIVEDAAYLERRQGVHPGDVLVVSTDGLWETFNPAGEMFGMDRVREVIRANAVRDAAAMVDALAEAVSTFRRRGAQQDDVTIVVVKVLAQ